jgi:hypothetical protein
MTKTRTFKVVAEWDSEADGWLVTSQEIKGLTLSAKTTEDIHKKLFLVAPALLKAHGVSLETPIEIKIDFEGQKIVNLNSEAA